MTEIELPGKEGHTFAIKVIRDFSSTNPWEFNAPPVSYDISEHKIICAEFEFVPMGVKIPKKKRAFKKFMKKYKSEKRSLFLQRFL